MTFVLTAFVMTTFVRVPFVIPNLIVPMTHFNNSFGLIITNIQTKIFVLKTFFIKNSSKMTFCNALRPDDECSNGINSNDIF
jgi:hypothetical protein